MKALEANKPGKGKSNNNNKAQNNENKKNRTKYLSEIWNVTLIHSHPLQNKKTKKSVSDAVLLTLARSGMSALSMPNFCTRDRWGGGKNILRFVKLRAHAGDENIDTLWRLHLKCF